MSETPPAGAPGTAPRAAPGTVPAAAPGTTPEAAPAPPPAAPAYLTVRDVARRLQVDEKTVRRWREEHRLPPALAVGGVVRWRPEAIDAWLADREETP